MGYSDGELQYQLPSSARDRSISTAKGEGMPSCRN
jgi:hypothetical protein